jgi:hypothetical protein
VTTPGLSTAGRRLPRWLVAVADQGLVAVLNLALSISVAQVAGVTLLGRFALVAATSILCMGVARLLVTDPWLASRAAPSVAVGELRWLVLLAALLAALVLWVTVLVTCGGDHRWYIAVLIAPAMVLQDFGRYLAFRVERPARAFLSDLAVLLTATAVVGAAALTGHATLTAILLGWLAGLTAGALTSGGTMVGRLSPVGSGAWWNRHCRSLATKLAFDTVAYMVGVTGSLYALAYVATQRDVGLVRIVQTMFSPVALTVTGLTMWLVPVLANRDPDQAEAVRKRVTLWLGMACIPLVLAAVVIGSPLARLVFGVTDVPGVAALTMAAVSATAMAVAAPWVASARVTGHYLPIAWSRAAAAALTLTGMVTVTALHGATGYLGLLAFQNVTVAVAAIVIGLRTRAATPVPSHKPD